MKKIFISLFVLGNLLFTACADTFLNLQPEQAVDAGTAIVDKKSATAALNGAYNQLQADDYYGGTGFIATIYLSGDNVSWTGSLNYYRDFNTHNYQADNTAIEMAWTAIYKTVNAANQVIDKVSKLNNIDPISQNKIIGEALFIRALAHFDLARTWGNIPIITQATETVKDFDGVQQSPAKVVYAQVIADLERALSLLPINATAQRTRASQASVQALLARTHLYLQNWDKAAQYATLLIDHADYELIDYPSFFQQKESRESILELNYTASDKNVHWHQWFAPDQGGRHEWAPSPELVALLADPNIGGTRKTLYKDVSTTTAPNYFVGLLYHRTNGDDPAYLFRIAEQYLIRAEARAKGSQPILSEVLSDLNAVKTRAQVQISTANTLTKAILDIENERRLEFAFEPHRWFDLVRTQRAGEVLGVTNVHKWIFPIPYNDLQADKDLIQNKEY